MISSHDELEKIVSGLLNTVDQLDTLMMNDGFMRNNFAFFVEELKADINQILEEMNVAVV